MMGWVMGEGWWRSEGGEGEGRKGEGRERSGVRRPHKYCTGVHFHRTCTSQIKNLIG